MRIKIVLAPMTEPSFLPLDHYPLASLIYRTVGLVNPGYAEFLHNQGYGEEASGNKIFKLFVYSRPYLPQTLLNKGQENRAWFARGEIVWQVSSPQPEFIQSFVTGLIGQGEVTIGDPMGSAQFSVESIEEMEVPAFQSPMRFKTISPITVSVVETNQQGQRHKQFLWGDVPRFGELVAANLKKKYRVLTGDEPPEGKVTFAFEEEYIRRRGGVRGISKMAQYKDTNIRGFQAPFIVSGPLELIQLGWECGFGEANSKGFGMVEAAPWNG